MDSQGREELVRLTHEYGGEWGINHTQRLLRLVALTRGGRGSILTTLTERNEHPGLRVEVEDTVGSGDAFTAALVVGLLSGHDLATVNAAANRLGAFVASQSGATPALPTDLLDTLWVED